VVNSGSKIDLKLIMIEYALFATITVVMIDQRWSMKNEYTGRYGNTVFGEISNSQAVRYTVRAKC
jgi:hypothetical protein